MIYYPKTTTKRNREMLRKWRNHQRQTNPKSKLFRYIKLALLVAVILVWGLL